MSIVKEAWASLRAVAVVIDKVQEQQVVLKELRIEVRDLRERLIAAETIIELARAPRLPGRS